MKYKIVIVDDHLLFSNSLKMMINSFEDFEVSHTFDNGKKLKLFFQHDENNEEIDIILLDVNMPVLGGIDTMKWLKENKPNQKVLALSVNDKPETIIKMLQFGAKGYLLKDTTPSVFQSALLEVIQSGFFYTEYVTNIILNKIDGKKEEVILKDKELKFIQHACTKKTYKEIADIMFLSPKTIDGYRDAVFTKLNIKTRVGLVMYAIKNNLVQM